jgi:formylglycine-generating enzyme required for sulfatase activity
VRVLEKVLLALCIWVCAWFGTPSHATAPRCPNDMVNVLDSCVDRYEMALVDKATGAPLSPYYPPEPSMLRFVHDRWQVLRFSVGDESVRRMPLPALSELQTSSKYTPKAVSRAGLVPQAYLSYYSAKRACAAAGKRLCTPAEWERACRGQADQAFPYGPTYRPEVCNVSKRLHPAAILHGLSSSGHLDPRLNLLLVEGEVPLLRLTGESAQCVSRFGNDGIFDMVGNLDEWVDDEKGAFRGGFYARRSHNGCAAQITNHSPTYFDYSTGARCCRDAAAAQ